MSPQFRCPMCGRPLRRTPGLERVLPHSRGWDCPQRHAHTSSPDEWEKARIAQYKAEIDRFLHPSEDVVCLEYDWNVIEVNATLAVLECSRCAALTAMGVRGSA